MDVNSKESGKRDQEIEQLRYMQNAYAEQYELLGNEITTLSMAINTVRKDIDLIENMERVENSTVLFNSQGNIYMNANVGKVDSVIVYVGANYLIAKSLGEAESFLKRNIEKQEAGLKRLIGERQKIEKELFDISYKLSTIQ
ncbi:prefoldin subunit alpha [Candidatus Marsarchaeota archaeon]|nr:prefoldin subunit alpha [Candidatus Marsarchaeota archaeon]